MAPTSPLSVSMRITALRGLEPCGMSPCEPGRPSRQMNFGPGSVSTNQLVNPVIFIVFSRCSSTPRLAFFSTRQGARADEALRDDENEQDRQDDENGREDDLGFLD